VEEVSGPTSRERQIYLHRSFIEQGGWSSLARHDPGVTDNRGIAPVGLFVLQFFRPCLREPDINQGARLGKTPLIQRQGADHIRTCQAGPLQKYQLNQMTTRQVAKFDRPILPEVLHRAPHREIASAEY